MKSYKYALALTSQLPFCSVPLRLDSYNQCQFACAYCFSKSRGGNSEASGLQVAKADTLEKRLTRVSKGDIRNAIDEFLQRRIPIQFGGMNDPFSPWEQDHAISMSILKVLAKFDYPTLISTKSVLPSIADYLAVLKDGNFLVRHSLIALSRKLQPLVEKGVPTISMRLSSIEKMANFGIAVSVRLQPIFFGHEAVATRLIRKVAFAGARHVSAEYLKLPLEKDLSSPRRLAAIIPDARATYIQLGAHRVGREYVLPIHLKYERLSKLKAVATDCGLHFGFAENGLLHLNEFSSCCNGADLFLRNASYFDASILGIMKGQQAKKEIRFPTKPKFWLPEHSVFSHINSNSRPDPSGDNRGRFLEFLRKKWNSKGWRGGPASFWGVNETERFDSHGNAVYVWT